MKKLLLWLVLHPKIITQKHRDFNIETHTAFIDYKNASGIVNRNKLMDILIEGNVPNQLIMSIYGTYKHNVTAIKHNQRSLNAKKSTPV
jgi:hypothetical protein